LLDGLYNTLVFRSNQVVLLSEFSGFLVPTPAILLAIGHVKKLLTILGAILLGAKGKPGRLDFTGHEGRMATILE
jgi:hypothetical protein